MAERKGTWAGKRWPGFAETGGQTGADGQPVSAELQPSVDPRTTPVPSGLELHVLEGEDAGKTFPLETWEVVLGRRMTPEEKKTGWILFNEPTVSRMHAVLEWRAGPRRYRMDHQSRTNPTLINGRLVQQAILYPDDMVRLGDLTFQIRVRRPADAAWDDEHPQVEDKGLIYSGFKASVVKGPDAGQQFVLEHKVIHIGGPEAQSGGKAENWIALTDPNLPREQAFLVWYDADKRYGIFHAGTSPIPTQISRVLSAPRPEGKEETRNLLQVDDIVMLGETVIMIMKHERFLETGRALRADAPSTPAERPRAQPPAARAKKFDFTSGRKILEIVPQPARKEEAEPEPQIITRVRGSGPPAAALPGGSAASPALGDRPFEATSNWFVQPDYVIEMIEGPEVGRRISLMSSAVRSDRVLGIGTRGKRVNDIEIEGEGISNQQACIHFRDGRFFLTNEAGGIDLSVNEQPLDPGATRQLKNGDEIQISKNLLLFIDRQALERQYQFELEVTEEAGRMSGRVITLNQESHTIGRAKTCDIRVDDPAVSRMHAVVSFRRGGFVLEHKSESNHTFVNGVSLTVGKERVLENDDEIHLSDKTVLIFRRRHALDMS